MSLKLGVLVGGCQYIAARVDNQKQRHALGGWGP